MTWLATLFISTHFEHGSFPHSISCKAPLKAILSDLRFWNLFLLSFFATDGMVSAYSNRPFKHNGSRKASEVGINDSIDVHKDVFSSSKRLFNLWLRISTGLNELLQLPFCDGKRSVVNADLNFWGIDFNHRLTAEYSCHYLLFWYSCLRLRISL